ncbi:MAG: FAD/NAD(P)-binding protein [Candidatus Cloacimonetes bacterium]|nr:FAD/NAD(P)-binding protein [Candidatus Cloacimonadota bacterium]
MRNSYIPIPVKVSKIISETEDKTLRTYDIAFCNEKDEENFNYLPGQFCELSILGKGEAPFGIASSPTERDFLKFTVNRAGSVTTEIHYLQEGEEIGLRGPFGNYYPVEKFKGENIVIISGGFAFTTLRSLAVYLRHPQNRGDYKNITIIYGARTPDLMLYKDELSEWEKQDDVKLYLTIDKPVDGWDKMVGFVPTVTEKIAPSPEKTWVVVCGPPIMIKFTLPVLSKLGFPAERIYTSLERRMKCGIGKCGRCNIGSKYVCLDGPVFSYAELLELPEAF